MTEGSEPAAFWDALGGKTEYASGKWLESVVPNHPPRLFQCSNASGRFKVEEIFDFSQEVSEQAALGSGLLLLPLLPPSSSSSSSYLLLLPTPPPLHPPPISSSPPILLLPGPRGGRRDDA